MKIAGKQVGQYILEYQAKRITRIRKPITEALDCQKMLNVVFSTIVLSSNKAY